MRNCPRARLPLWADGCVPSGTEFHVPRLSVRRLGPRYVHGEALPETF